jgi:hypothetical protein
MTIPEDADLSFDSDEIPPVKNDYTNDEIREAFDMVNTDMDTAYKDIKTLAKCLLGIALIQGIEVVLRLRSNWKIRREGE